MRTLHLTSFVLVTGLTALSGCTKSACELEMGGIPVPAAFPWDKQQELTPPGAKMCGVHEPDHATARFSFPKNDNPFVTAVDHLESKGWKRETQDTKNPDFITAKLTSGRSTINLRASRLKGYENHVEMEMTDSDCFVNPAKDGSACRSTTRGAPRQIIKCQMRNWVSDGPLCASDEMCAVNEGAGSISAGATARCVKLK